MTNMSERKNDESKKSLWKGHVTCGVYCRDPRTSSSVGGGKGEILGVSNNLVTSHQETTHKIFEIPEAGTP